MTLYAGETAQIRHYAEDYSGEPLTDGDATVTITIWDLADAVLVNEAPMTYDATLTFDNGEVGGWFYIWASPADAPGAYLARCTATGGGDISAFEFKRIRLRQDKAPA